MALQQDGKIAIFFEEAPCYGDDYTKGYCMVYVPLTIEEITKGAYKGNEIPGEPGTDVAVHPSLLTPQPSTGIYDLMGRKLDKVGKKGVYIVGGKKVIK